MRIELSNINGTDVAEVLSDAIEINNAGDALDIIAGCVWQGASAIILHQKNIVPEFFDLRTGIAGEIVQKFVNYKVRVAIVGDYSGYSSGSLLEFIRESNTTGGVRFVSTVAEAAEKLTGR